jgi:hypothetical protein
LIVILGLIIVAAAIAGVDGNGGSAHGLAHGFSVLGYHVTGSTGALLLPGIVAGEAAPAGLGLLLAGARRGRDARRGLKQARRETAAVTPGT